MTRATLTVEPAPDLDERARRIVVDCPHGRTEVLAVTAGDPDAAAAHDAACARLAVLKHYSEEGCRCTRELRRRYGLARAWA